MHENYFDNNTFLEIDEFQRISIKFIEIVERFSREVEKQKMKAIGARNYLQCMEKQKENNYQQLQVNNYNFQTPRNIKKLFETINFQNKDQVILYKKGGL